MINFSKYLFALWLGTLAVQASEEKDDELVINPFPSELICDLKLKPYQNFLLGPNVFMRPLFPSDHLSSRPIFTDPNVMKYFGRGKTLSLEEIEKGTLLKSQSNNLINPPSYAWSIITKDGIAGRFYVTFPNENENKTEIAYCIAPSFGGKGVTTEAGQLALNFLSGPFVATVHPKNIASARVLEKLGFKPDLAHQNVPKFGSIRNYYVLENEE